MRSLGTAFAITGRIRIADHFESHCAQIVHQVAHVISVELEMLVDCISRQVGRH